MFACLAYQPDKPHAREALIDWMWPDDNNGVSLDEGRNNLSTALSHLRSQLEPPGIARGTVLRADRATAQINPDAIHTDVSDFKAALQKAGEAQSQEARAEWLMKALGMYKGELLPDFYDDWVERERRNLAGDFERAARQLIAHFKAAGQPGLAIDYATRLVAAVPDNEEAHCELMRLYRAQGDFAAALRQYRLLEQHLAPLEDAPSAETRDLAAEIEKEKRRRGEEERKGTGDRGQETEEKIRDTRYEIQEGANSSFILHPSSFPTHVALLLTDIERSTLQWIAGGEGYASVLAQHHALLRAVFRRHGGVEAKETGDGFIILFENIANALTSSLEAQQALAEANWPTGLEPPRVRMAAHCGHVHWENGDARGLAIHHVARLAETAHGGQVVCSEAAFMLAAYPEDPETGIRLKPLGVYRLRDFPDPQKLFQVCRSDRPGPDFPPLKALPGYADSLPLSTTRFVGREQELAQLQSWLSPPAPEQNTPPCRLLTLTGMGGAGKTRLALELAGRMAGMMEGAVWHVPLVDVTEARGLADALRQHLNLPHAPNSELLEQLTELLSRRPSLLLLDNFEQLLSTRDEQDGEPSDLDAAALVGELLARAPTLTLLVTSRHRLRLEQEREFPVPPLQTPDVFQPLTQSQNDIYLTKLNGCESVRLLVERAQEARPDFQLTLKNAPAIAELCARLEGLPLAIELAAARAQILTPAQMLAQLNDRFKFLVSRSRNITPRQRSLRASLDMSYALLSPPLQRFLAQLSIFRGGWTWEAAEAIAKAEGRRMKDEEGSEKIQDTRYEIREGANSSFILHPSAFDVLDYLAELRDSSLILAEGNEGQIRFRLLETLREYADEQLSEAEREATRQAHYAYYLALSEQSEAELSGPEQTEWLNRLESEHDNLRAALRGTNNAEARLRLAGALYRFWEGRDHLQEGRFWLETAEQAEDMGTLVQAKALNGAGVLANKQGDYSAARRFLEHSRALYQTLGNAHGVALASNNLGNALRVQGHYPEAQSSYEAAEAIWRQAESWSTLASVQNNLGIISLNLGDTERAQAHFETSLQTGRRAGDDMRKAAALVNLGRVFLRQSRHGEAQACLEESLALFRKLGRKTSVAIALLNLGGLIYERQGCAAAWPLFVESLQIRQEVEDRSGFPIVLEVMAQAMNEQGRWERAAHLLGAATALRLAFGAPLPVAERDEYARDVAAIQTGLGRKAFQAAWEQGLAMTREQALAYACAQNPE